MKTIDDLEKTEIRDILHKNWITHDAMWLLNCAWEFGMDTTNKINRNAANGMAQVEAKRIAKLMDVDKVESFEDFRRFIDAASEIVKAGFMDFSITYPEENVVHWEMHSCFAHDGVKKIGFIDQYQCGIFERMKGWLKSLGIEYKETPEVEGCMMRRDGKCYRDFILEF